MALALVPQAAPYSPAPAALAAVLAARKAAAAKRSALLAAMFEKLELAA